MQHSHQLSFSPPLSLSLHCCTLTSLSVHWTIDLDLGMAFSPMNGAQLLIGSMRRGSCLPCHRSGQKRSNLCRALAVVLHRVALRSPYMVAAQRHCLEKKKVVWVSLVCPLLEIFVPIENAKPCKPVWVQPIHRFLIGSHSFWPDFEMLVFGTWTNQYGDRFLFQLVRPAGSVQFSK